MTMISRIKYRIETRLLNYILRDTDSNMMAKSRRELEIWGAFDDDGMYDGMIGKAAMQAMSLFAREGHSGMSASIMTGLMQRLMKQEPLTPLTGDDDEWIDHGDEQFQNNRCSHVFKEGKDGQPYDGTGRVFREPDGGAYTSRDSRVDITFPYTPVVEYVDVEAPA